MKEYPLVSVILPCYNAMPYLEEALLSIIHQTYKNLEIICIDDGSTDDTFKLLEYYAQTDKRIKLIRNEQNMGLIRTLNKAISFCNGEYIARMDADDISAPVRIEKELEFLLTHPEVDLVSCASFFISEKGLLVGMDIIRQKSYLANYFASFFYTPHGHPELLSKKSVFIDNPYRFDTTTIHVEDYELWARLLKMKYQLWNMDEHLHASRINQQSVSRKFTELQDSNFINLVRQHIESYLSVKIPKEIAYVISNRMNSAVGLNHLMKGLQIIRNFRRFFLEKEKISSKKIKKEINIVYFSHVYDICIQAMKRLSFASKCYAFFYMLFNIKGLFYGKIITYLLNKFRFISYLAARKKFNRLFPSYHEYKRYLING
ncbi:MAG: glycosyltransferase family 2 protein [Bacteroidales bacterium]|nr:glycosyltransferase family 2 protein [Bacteroidales bacterium]